MSMRTRHRPFFALVVLLACGKSEPESAPDKVVVTAGDAGDGATANSENGPFACEVKLVDPSVAKPLATWTPCSTGGDCSATLMRDQPLRQRNGGVFVRRDETMSHYSFEDIEGKVLVSAEIPPSCYPYVFVGPMGVAIDHRGHYFRDGVYPVPPRIVSFVRWDAPTKVETHAIAETSGATGPWSMSSGGSSLNAACAAEHVMLIGMHASFDMRCDGATLHRFAKPLAETSFEASPELGPFTGWIGVLGNDRLAVIQDGAARVIGGGQPATVFDATTNVTINVDHTDDTFVSIEHGDGGPCDGGTAPRALGQRVLRPDGTVESKSLGTFDLSCEDLGESMIAHDGLVAVGSPPVVVRRSDGVKLDAKFEYASQAGNFVERVVYVDAKWLVTTGRDGIMRRPLSTLPTLP